MNILLVPLLIGVAMVACGQVPTTPSPSKLKPLGLVEITFSGVGSQLRASARTVGFRTQAFTDLSDGIQLQLVSRGSFDVGTRGVDGTRFLSATFKVRNATASGTPSALARQNLSFVAVGTDSTLAQTAISRLTRFDGTRANPLIARSIVPTHGMEFRGLSPRVASGLEDFQAFSENEVAPLATSLRSSGVTTVFPYGFVARCVQNCQPDSRRLGANPLAGQFDGLVTFAVKLPLQASAQDDPFSFSLLFEVVDDDTARVTKSAEENLVAPVQARAAALPGSSLSAGSALCALRTAGSDPNAPLEVIRGTGFEAAGTPDACFAGTGQVATRITGSDAGFGVVAQRDGKIVVLGQSFDLATVRFTTVLLRYRPDGSLDETFGNAGIVSTPLASQPRDLHVQDDGKLLVAGIVVKNTGNADFELARFNPDGSLDSSFGVAGVTRTDLGSSNDFPQDIAVQPDGSIVVVGTSNDGFAAVRYRFDGDLDSSFGVGGVVVTDIQAGQDVANAVAIQADQKIVLAGTTRSASTNTERSAVVRYRVDGTLDTSFGGTGIVRPNFGGSFDGAEAVGVQPDGKPVVFGRSAMGGAMGFALLRLQPDGKPDSSFGTLGVVLTNLIPRTTSVSSVDRGKRVVIQSDGKILCAGDSRLDDDIFLALTRHNPDGSLDRSFGENGKVTTFIPARAIELTGLAVQSDGKVVLAGFKSGPGVVEMFAARFWR
jgi:uncharacterized delta-60 repeat protein